MTLTQVVVRRISTKEQVRTDRGKSWNLSHIFQARKILESGVGPGKLWKCE